MKEESQTSPLTQNNVEALCNRDPLFALSLQSPTAVTALDDDLALESPKAESKSLPLSLESPEAEHNVEVVFSLATARETEQRRRFGRTRQFPRLGNVFGQRVGKQMPRLLRWSARKQPQYRTYNAFFKNVR
ncbi:Hypothetical predicted protein, partial [Olea europaea subsp. europaea]